MTREEAYARFGEAAWGMPMDDYGNVIVPSTPPASGSSPYGGAPVSPVYTNWLAQGNTPSAETMPLDVFRAWQNIGDDRMNPDGSIQGTTGRVNPATGNVDYKLTNDSLLGSFLEFAEIPAIFGAAILGGGALNNLITGAGAAGGAAAPTIMENAVAGYGAGVPSGTVVGSGIGGVAGGMPVTPLDPFAYTPEFPLGNLNVPSNINVPGVDLTQTFPVTGVNAAPTLPATGFPQIDFGTNFTSLSGRPTTPSVPGAASSPTPTTTPPVGGTSSGTNNDIIEEVGNFTGSAGAPATAAGAGTALSRILDGTATTADWLSILGTAGSSLLGMVGSNQQADSLRDIANQARADRQPFLNKSLEWMNDPAAYAAGPGKAGLDATLRALSVQGNPFGSPTNIALAGDVANRNWQNAVTGFGNLGLSGQDSRNQLLTGAVQAEGGALNSLGYGLENIFNPRPQNNLNNMLRQFGLT